MKLPLLKRKIVVDKHIDYGLVMIAAWVCFLICIFLFGIMFLLWSIWDSIPWNEVLIVLLIFFGCIVFSFCMFHVNIEKDKQ